MQPSDSTARSMQRPAGVNRRGFLGITLGALLAGKVQLPGVVRAQPPLASDDCPRFGVFDDATFALLEAVAEQIVPADQDPGATDLCSASLVEATAAGDAGTAQLLIAGLAALDASSVLLHGVGFVDLPFPTQTELLELVEAGQAPGEAWEHVLFARLRKAPEEPVPEELARYLETIDRLVPTKHTLANPGAAQATLTGSEAQQTVFGVLRTLCKLAFVLNFPEMSVRNPDGTPIFTDAEHLISDPDDDSTLTGWTIVNYHEIDYRVEKLMWEWQAGFRVIGFDGVPILDTASPLSDAERLQARDILYALSDNGLA
ncbi:MAG: gluconate 2-dehydrogenase subunit 3 family protein [Acidobacteriota bacterium]